jgi:hypothetical protein
MHQNQEIPDTNRTENSVSSQLKISLGADFIVARQRSAGTSRTSNVSLDVASASISRLPFGELPLLKPHAK